MSCDSVVENQLENEQHHLRFKLTLYALTGRIRPVLPKFQF